jgi:3-methyladenine DNA glycosylase AlkD
MKKQEVRKLLENQAEESYKQFNHKIVPGVKNVIGVRLPALRKIGKEISGGDFKEYFAELDGAEKDTLYYEEIMLQGIIIGAIKVPPCERLKYIESYIFKIDNWAICDTFCTSLKFVKKNPQLVWEFIQDYLKDDREFFVRFGVVILMSFYINEEYIERDLQMLENIQNDGYYAKMGVAWALSVCFVKYPDITRDFFKKSYNKLDEFTYNKAIQKIRESFRVTREDKEFLKTLKRT